jgi:N-acetylglucosamine kinase-like BadF-type ATPase
VPGQLHDSLRMFALCEAMEWSHLPNAGGLYRQSPKLLDDFYQIWIVKGKIEEKKARKDAAERRKMEAQNKVRGSRGRRR